MVKRNDTIINILLLILGVILTVIGIIIFSVIVPRTAVPFVPNGFNVSAVLVSMLMALFGIFFVCLAISRSLRPDMTYGLQYGFFFGLALFVTITGVFLVTSGIYSPYNILEGEIHWTMTVNLVTYAIVIVGIFFYDDLTLFVFTYAFSLGTVLYNSLGQMLRFYATFWWFDLNTHFLSGVIIALFIINLEFLTYFSKNFKGREILVQVLITYLVSFTFFMIFEIFEFPIFLSVYGDNPFLSAQFWDNVTDIIADMIGVTIGVLIWFGFKKLENRKMAISF